MKKKDKMLKKFYRTKPESEYFRIIEDIEKEMSKSTTECCYIVKGNEEERNYVINRLKSDGFDVSIEAHYAGCECDIRVKWL